MFSIMSNQCERSNACKMLRCNRSILAITCSCVVILMSSYKGWLIILIMYVVACVCHEQYLFIQAISYQMLITFFLWRAACQKDLLKEYIMICVCVGCNHLIIDYDPHCK